MNQAAQFRGRTKRLSTSSVASQSPSRQEGNSSFIEDERAESDKLNLSLLELERRHDRLLTRSPETSHDARKSKFVFEFASKLQIEHDRLKSELESLKQENALQQRTWEEERKTLEKRKEKSNRILREELERATSEMNSEIERCGARIREMKAGVDLQLQEETKRMQQSVEETKAAYERRLQVLDRSLLEQKARVQDKELAFKALMEAHERDKQVWQQQLHDLEASSKAALELAMEKLLQQQSQQQEAQKPLVDVIQVVGKKRGTKCGGVVWTMVVFAMVLLAFFVAVSGNAGEKIVVQGLRLMWCKLIGIQLLPPPS